MKFTQTTYGNKKGILRFPDHYVAVPVTVDDSGVTANGDGKKIVPAGTLVGGGVLADPTAKVAALNTAATEGVLMEDADVTYGPAPAAMMLHGFVDLATIPAAPSTEAKAALAGRIVFLK